MTNELLAVRVGRRIRTFRRVRGLSVVQLGGMIGKSAATVYKYESGEIPPDVNQLQQIAQALQVDASYLLDVPAFQKLASVHVPYLDTGRLFTYYYDGRIGALVKSLLLFYPSSDGNRIQALFYINLPEFETPEHSRYLYSGTLTSHETVSYFIMENITLPIETLVIQLVHPMQTSQTTWGIFMGLSDEPVTPMTTKMLFSRAPLGAKDLAAYPLCFTKEELKNIKKKNALLLSIRESAHQGLRP